MEERTDPIVTEVRRLRQQHAEKFDYDLRRIFEDLKRSEAGRDRGRSPLLAPSVPVGKRARFQRGSLVHS